RFEKPTKRKSIMSIGVIWPRQQEPALSEKGWKLHQKQLSKFPFVGHLLFSDKKDLLLPDNGEILQTLENYLTGNRYKYQQFLRQKGRYPSFDIYACFHPFN